MIGGGQHFIAGGGIRTPHSSDVLLIECNPGHAIPRRISELIPNGDDHLHHLKKCCKRAKTFEEFDQIVKTFNRVMEIGDSITAIEEGHSVSEVILNTLYSPIGILFDSRWSPKSFRMRFLRIDSVMLRTVRFNPHDIPVAQIQLVNPVSSSSPPIAQARVI